MNYKLQESIKRSKAIASTNTPAVDTRHTLRLSQAEYALLSQRVAAEMQKYRETDAGSLGIRLGSEIVLSLVREGFTHA